MRRHCYLDEVVLRANPPEDFDVLADIDDRTKLLSFQTAVDVWEDVSAFQEAGRMKKSRCTELRVLDGNALSNGVAFAMPWGSIAVRPGYSGLCR